MLDDNVFSLRFYFVILYIYIYIKILHRFDAEGSRKAIMYYSTELSDNGPFRVGDRRRRVPADGFRRAEIDVLGSFVAVVRGHDHLTIVKHPPGVT